MADEERMALADVCLGTVLFVFSDAVANFNKKLPLHHMAADILTEKCVAVINGQMDVLEYREFLDKYDADRRFNEGAKAIRKDQAALDHKTPLTTEQLVTLLLDCVNICHQAGETMCQTNISMFIEVLTIVSAGLWQSIVFGRCDRFMKDVAELSVDLDAIRLKPIRA